MEYLDEVCFGLEHFLTLKLTDAGNNILLTFARVAEVDPKILPGI